MAGQGKRWLKAVNGTVAPAVAVGCGWLAVVVSPLFAIGAIMVGRSSSTSAEDVGQQEAPKNGDGQAPKGRDNRGRFGKGNKCGVGQRRKRHFKKANDKEIPPLPRHLLGQGLEGVWRATCRRALEGDSRTQIEVLRLVGARPPTSKDELTKAWKTVMQDDWDVVEQLPHDLQVLACEREMWVAATELRLANGLPVTEEEARVATAAAAVRQEMAEMDE